MHWFEFALGLAAGLALAGIAFALRAAARRRTAAPRSPQTPWPTAAPPTPPGVVLRYEVQPSDLAAVRRIVASTGMFRPGEIDVAVELVEARLTRGAASGYEFAFLERAGEVLGYACFGRNTLTVSSFDLYWIAVDQSLRGQGLGAVLLAEFERLSRAAGATRLYIETSHRPDYAGTRRFYERSGYQLAALLPDFYAPGDDRAIFVRELAAAAGPGPKS